MGMTIVEKILARACGRTQVAPGDIVTVKPASIVLIDPTFFFLNQMNRRVLKVDDPDKVVVVFDHEVPAVNIISATAQATGREFVKRFGIKRFHDVGYEQGISHVIVVDNGYALPGTLLVGSDSHSLAAGTLNCAGRAITFLDLMYALTTGETWVRVSETIRYDLYGHLQPGVSAKDLFLHVAGTYGDHNNYSIEFGGPALEHLSINARRTLSTMGTELGAEFAVFEADDRTVDYVRERSASVFEPQNADKDAVYASRRTIDLNTIGPLIALPDTVLNNTVPVTKVTGEKIDQAFIGSCANGTLDDMIDAAGVLNNRRVADGVRLIVTPGTQQIYREALKLGLIETLMNAGAVVTSATCGACGGGHMGILGPNETCITSSTRNFKGRMGDPSARIFMGSSTTVAASAVAGVIVNAAIGKG